MNKIAVLVTTNFSGVYFGYLDVEGDEETWVPGPSLWLQQARAIVYWAPEVHGYLGIAANGVSESCRVSPAVPRYWVQGVTSVALVTPEAAAKIEKEPWK